MTSKNKDDKCLHYAKTIVLSFDEIKKDHKEFQILDHL